MPSLPTENKQVGSSFLGRDTRHLVARGGASSKSITSLEKWLDFFSHVDIPVLQSTIDSLNRLKERESKVTAREIAGVILRDPMMTLKVLIYMQERRVHSHSVEITTVEHVVMMIGVTPFFEQFQKMQAAEEILEKNPDAMDGFMATIDQSQRAALYASEWVTLRHDIESDEIIIATLLHDIVETLLWCLAPEYVIRIERKTRQDHSLDSAAVQKSVLGISLIELQLQLREKWHLPVLLQTLMDDIHNDSPRVRNVALAVKLAMHSSNGWSHSSLRGDYAAIGKLVGANRHEVMVRARRASLKAIRGLTDYGMTRPASWLPPIPEDEDTEHDPSAVMARVTGLLSPAASKNMDFVEVLSIIFHGIHSGIGLNRVLFMEINAECSQATAKFVMGTEEASLLRRIEIDLVNPHVFSRLMGKMESIWYSAETKNELQSLLLEEMIKTIWKGVGNCEFFAMPILVDGEPIGLVYADGGLNHRALNLEAYNDFQRLCLVMTKSLERE
jgi:HD-like signal output (HDOD) protein